MEQDQNEEDPEIKEEDLSSSDSDESDEDEYARSLISIKSTDGTLGFIISKTNYFLVLTQYVPDEIINNKEGNPVKQKYFSAKAVFEKSERLREEENGKVYLKIQREPGSGPVRLNEKLTMREDLYSYLFITCFHAEYIHEA